MFNRYFHSVFSDSSDLSNVDNHLEPTDHIDFISITIEEVYDALVSLDPTKAPGIDLISPKILQTCAPILCQPLHHLFSMSLQYAYIPSSWKIHKIVPIFKAGDKTSVKNYRPISLLSSTSKVLERLVYNKIVNHLVTQINPCQFGFIKGASTLQQLLTFFDFLTNSPTQIDTIYLDIRKAFDTVSHGILLNHLWSFGITGTLWSWFKCYITDRVQQVSINNTLSDSVLPVISGVPQGSILGPLLFLVYMNNISSSIEVSQVLKFADDMKCFMTISCDEDCIKLQQDVDSIIHQTFLSNLTINFTKCVHVPFKSTSNTRYLISSTEINCQETQKDLGVIVSSDLKWSNHYNSIISKAYKSLALIRRTFCSNHYPSVKLHLYITLVRPHLTYCSQLWRPYLIKDILCFERIQRRATKHILNNYNISYKSRLLELHLLPFMYILEIQDVLFAIKSLKSPTRNFDINRYITFTQGHTRSSTHNKLKHRLHSTNLNRNSYFHRLPRLWNALPVINTNLSIATIKAKLKKFMWNHFVTHFDDDNHCTYHYLCPCSKCHDLSPPSNFQTL